MDFKLADSEYKFMCIIWDNPSITSGKLVIKAKDILGWKKSTTYTVIKRLIEKNVIENKDSIVTPLINKDTMQQQQSNQIIHQNFDGSLPVFLTAFMQGKKLTNKEVEELKKLIDEHKE